MQLTPKVNSFVDVDIDMFNQLTMSMGSRQSFADGHGQSQAAAQQQYFAGQPESQPQQQQITGVSFKNMNTLSVKLKQPMLTVKPAIGEKLSQTLQAAAASAADKQIRNPFDDEEDEQT